VTTNDAEYLTPAEIAQTLRVSKMSAYRLINNGTIPGVRVGRSLRVTRTDFDTYLQQSAIVPVEAASPVNDRSLPAETFGSNERPTRGAS
jgi:excisionase family DNA binding protein